MDHEKAQELTVHVIFAALLFASASYGEQLAKNYSAWKEPRVGVFALVIGLVWVVWFFLRRIRELQDRQRILEDRIDRAQRKIDDLEDEERLR
ncbi:MAG: hypothetical protein CSA62_01980 [Planctomycetota bacterium]|nr:MAG: hypothetical protein CSA62_01980 [Planctomycetota bacterium]